MVCIPSNGDTADDLELLLPPNFYILDRFSHLRNGCS